MHLTKLAREYGDKPAVIMGESGDTLSYAELERQSNKVAHLSRTTRRRGQSRSMTSCQGRPPARCCAG